VLLRDLHFEQPNSESGELGLRVVDILVMLKDAASLSTTAFAHNEERGSISAVTVKVKEPDSGNHLRSRNSKTVNIAKKC